MVNLFTSTAAFTIGMVTVLLIKMTTCGMESILIIIHVLTVGAFLLELNGKASWMAIIPYYPYLLEAMRAVPATHGNGVWALPAVICSLLQAVA